MKKPRPSLLLILFIAILFSQFGQAQTIAGVINTSHKVTAINTTTNTLTLSGTSALSPGARILIIQMKGASIVSTNTASFGNISAINNAGNYEINEICGISGNDVNLKFQLLKSYDPTGFVQLVTVPVYSSVTIVDTLKAAAWNPISGTGGVLVMEATGTITMNSPIDVSGKGFVGGSLNNYAGCLWSTNVTAYSLPTTPADPNTNAARKGEGIANFITNNEHARGKQANGGGGGNNHNTGGGGGSNIGTGGQGGNRSGETFFQCHGTNAGIGGIGIQPFGYTTGNNRVFMGGGGGAGHQNNSVATAGGNGGGIILIKANTIAGTSAKFLANGAIPYNPSCTNPNIAEGDGGGGGGAGGTILLDVQNFSGSFIAEATGANGSVSGNLTNNCTGPGGGGGGGLLWVNGGSLPVNIIPVLNGGAAGFISLANSGGCGGQNNGATVGTMGTTLTGYQIPVAISFICAPLSSRFIQSFKGVIKNDYVELNWSLLHQGDIKSITVEKSINAIIFSPLKVAEKSITNFIDSDTKPGLNFYRLKVVDNNNHVEYSKTLVFEKPTTNKSYIQSIFPNPVDNLANILVQSSGTATAKFVLYKQTGQIVNTIVHPVSRGPNLIQYKLSNYPPGIYYISIEIMNEKQVKKIVVQR